MHDCMSTDTVKHEEVQVDPGWSRKERHSATEAGQSMHVSLEQRLSAQSILCDKQIAMALQLMLKASGRRKAFITGNAGGWSELAVRYTSLQDCSSHGAAGEVRAPARQR